MNKRSCFVVILAISVFLGLLSPVKARAEKTVTIRVGNWEEYIDLGDWDEEETIDLDSGDIIGTEPMVDEFIDWYYETYGIRVNVEYSAYGTNEDLYNMLNLGEVYDLICPSEYLMMKLLSQDALVPLSDEFFDESVEENYYSRMVSPFIREIFEEKEIDGEPWAKYMAGYMWGITGMVYNPAEVTKEEVSTWKILADPKYKRKVTVKDNIRDSYFAAVGAIKSDLLTSEEFLSDPNYEQRLEEEMNDTSPETVAKVEQFLKAAKNNAYSFESDAGKADMITKKVVINLQWSGDGVYTLDQADIDDFPLAFAVPVEATNIYFDGWVMMKNGISEDPRKQHACEAFINYISRPDNVIRNMYYTGYTSVIAGNEDDMRIFEYADWNFSAEEDEDDTIDYPVGYFFSGDDEDEDYIITAPSDAMDRQLFSQYPDSEALSRASVMLTFDDEASERINRMWINIRCMSINEIPAYAWILSVIAAATLIYILIRYKQKMK